MSVWSAEQEVKRTRSALEDARKKQAAEDKKAADLDRAAAQKEQSAARASTTSSAASYLREAQRKRDDATKARTRAADFSSKAATAQGAVHKAEERLRKAESDERTKAEREQQRQREKAERAARDAERERERAAQRERENQRRRDLEFAGLGQTVRGLSSDVAYASDVIARRPWENVPEVITVLFLAALPNGESRLHIDREIREVHEQVRRSTHRDSIKFEYRLAARLTDLIQHLNEVEPDVIHFSGHGSTGAIALHDANDDPQPLTNEQLAKVLGVAPKPLQLVVFNSCESAAQAVVAAEHARASIGMSESIEDDVAQVFAGQLYNALGFGRSVALALQQAELYVEMQLNKLSGKPIVVAADGVDLDELIIVRPSAHG